MNATTNANLNLYIARRAETAVEVAQAKDSFEAYWAQTVSASIMRDYRAGRVKTIRVPR